MTDDEKFSVMEWDGDAPGISYTDVRGVEELLVRLRKGSTNDHLAIDDGCAIALCEEILRLRNRSEA